MCLTGEEKEVWERQWKILLPGGQTRESLCQEEGDPASGGHTRTDSHTLTKMRPFRWSFLFWFRFLGWWTPGQRASQLLRILSGICLPDPSGAGQEEVWRGGTCEFSLCSVSWVVVVQRHSHLGPIETWFVGPRWSFTKPCSLCSDWTGAGVPSQHFNAQQPDCGDDSWLHALQTGAAAQPAERERCYWKWCSPCGVMSYNWTSIRFSLVSWLLSADEKPLWEHPRWDGGADEENEKPLADL